MGYTDLHCHWLPGVDDGVAHLADATALLRGLAKLGFDRVFASPHMRPGMFDNDAEQLTGAFAATCTALGAAGSLPELALGCEHYLCAEVEGRAAAGRALPHAGRLLLVELYDVSFGSDLQRRLVALRRLGLAPVIAHPERYPSLWQDPSRLDELLDVGAAAQLDLMALVGRYGRAPQRAARAYLERGVYAVAGSDAHRPSDVAYVERALRWVRGRHGEDELQRLLVIGPAALLASELR